MISKQKIFSIMKTLNNAINNDSADRILRQLTLAHRNSFVRTFFTDDKEFVESIDEYLFYKISTGQCDRHNQISNC